MTDRPDLAEERLGGSCEAINESPDKMSKISEEMKRVVKDKRAK